MAEAPPSAVRIFLRVKPSEKPTAAYRVTARPERLGTNFAEELVYDAQPEVPFTFHRVFDPSASQADVFRAVAQEPLLSVLQGFNATVFAYGQTGSGKTYTMTGPDTDPGQRGLIPRALDLLFEQLQARAQATPGYEWDVRVAYLQIYQEHHLTDLINGGKVARSMDDLPRVTTHLVNGQCELRGLQAHRVVAKDQALRLLFTGDLNKMFSETPMNHASSRSHCVFTVHFRGREPASDTWKCGKLNIVDLAGSERLKKTNSEGQLLQETKFINKSLFFLQATVQALADGERVVPYRDSQLTKVLADSLGGNCRTAMVATVSPDQTELGESIATCAFAQRVASIRTVARANEELDPSVVIKNLRARLAEMQDQLALAGTEAEEGDLTEEQVQLCKRAADAYLDCPTDSAEALRPVQGSVRRVLCTFGLVRAVVRRLRRQLQGLDIADGTSESGSEAADSRDGTEPEPTTSEAFDWWRRNKARSMSNRKTQAAQPLLRRLTPPRGALPVLGEAPLSVLSVSSGTGSTAGSAGEGSGEREGGEPQTPAPAGVPAGGAGGGARDRRIAELERQLSLLRGRAAGAAASETAELAGQLEQSEGLAKALQQQLRAKERERTALTREREELRGRLQQQQARAEEEMHVLLARVNKLEKKVAKWKRKAKDSALPVGGKGVSWGAPAAAPAERGPQYAPLTFQHVRPAGPRVLSEEEESQRFAELQQRMLSRQNEKQQLDPRPPGSGGADALPPRPAPLTASVSAPLFAGAVVPQPPAFDVSRSGTLRPPPHLAPLPVTAAGSRDAEETTVGRQVELIAAAETLKALSRTYDLGKVHDQAEADGVTALDDRERTFRYFRNALRDFDRVAAIRQQRVQLAHQAKAKGGELQAAALEVKRLRAELQGLQVAGESRAPLVPAADDGAPAVPAHLAELREALVRQITAAHQRSQAAAAELAGLKDEVERLQLHCDKVDQTVRRDFDTWWDLATAIANG